jgi:hypothetical protein
MFKTLLIHYKSGGRKMKKSVKLITVTALALFSASGAVAQTGIQPKIEIVEVKAAKQTESSMITQFEFELRITDLKEMYIKAAESVPTSVTDEKGTDLIAEGRKMLEKRNAEGFGTSTLIGWEFYDQRFSEIPNAFRARFTTFANPSPGSNYVNVAGKLAVTIRKPGNLNEIRLKNCNPAKADTMHFEGKDVIFIDNGSMTTGKNAYLIYTFNPELAVIEALTPGLPMPSDVSKNAAEIYVPKGSRNFDLVLKVAETEIIQIPVNMKVSLGL